MGQPNNAFSISGFFLRGKTKVTETIFPGHTKIVLTSKQTKRLHLQCEKERRPRVEWFMGFKVLWFPQVCCCSSLQTDSNVLLFCFHISYFSSFKRHHSSGALFCLLVNTVRQNQSNVKADLAEIYGEANTFYVPLYNFLSLKTHLLYFHGHYNSPVPNGAHDG